MREPAFDKADCSLKSDVLRRQNQMYMIRHDDKRVQFVVTQPPIVLESFEK